MILAARRVEALTSVADACKAAHKESGVQAGGKFAVVQLDVSDRKQVASFVDKIPEDLRKVDVLGMIRFIETLKKYLNICVTVNNAGFVLGVEKIGDISEDDMESMFRTNVFGLISVTQQFVKGEAICHTSRHSCYKSDF